MAGGEENKMLFEPFGESAVDTTRDFEKARVDLIGVEVVTRCR